MMFAFHTLLTTLALALVVTANPVAIHDSPVTLPLIRRLNAHADGAFDLLARDQARVSGLRRSSQHKLSEDISEASVANVNATNKLVDYVVSVDVGTPPTQFSLLVDTGSSNTWVGAVRNSFHSTSSTVQTRNTVSVTYGSGSFSGTEFTDTVDLGSGLTIEAQSIGVARRSQGFDGVDGILGIGPVDLTVGTLTNSRRTSIPTVTDNLFSQGLITSNLVAVSFAPPDSDSDANGELTFGGIDSSKFTGSISFAPITGTPPASEFWGIDQTITFGTTTILSSTAGIVDTGTTLVLIASDAFRRYQSATGGVPDDGTGLLSITPTQFAALQSLFFNINDISFELTANAQIWPRALNTLIGGTPDGIYLIVNNIGTPTGSGLDFINGMTFLERFYSVFDTANQQVGFATTSNTNSTSN